MAQDAGVARSEMYLCFLLPSSCGYNGYLDPDPGRSKQSPFPFTREITVDVVATAGDKLWKELVGNGTNLNITHVALGFTGIDISENGQQSIEGFLKSNRLGINKRSRELNETENGEPRTESNAFPDFPSISYTCSKCGKTVIVFLEEGTAADDDALEMARREHEDFHDAESLRKERGQRGNTAGLSAKPNRNKKGGRGQSDKRKGIEKFFVRK